MGANYRGSSGTHQKFYTWASTPGPALPESALGDYTVSTDDCSQINQSISTQLDIKRILGNKCFLQNAIDKNESMSDFYFKCIFKIDSTKISHRSNSYKHFWGVKSQGYCSIVSAAEVFLQSIFPAEKCRV